VTIAPLLRGITAAFFCLATFAHAQNHESVPEQPKLSMQELLPAILPTPRLDQPWWAERHQHIVDLLKTRPQIDLVLIGDSITQNYEKATPPDENFQPTWQQFYAPRHALNLGFSGDTTANVLWRLTHGELENLRPAVAILLIGTNNTGHDHQSADQTIVGINNIIGTLAQRLPQTRIILLGILPSDVSPEKSAADKAVNAYLAKRYGTKTEKAAAAASSESTPDGATSSGSATSTTEQATSTQQTAAATPDKAKTAEESRITYLDISSVFQNANGSLNTAIFYDPRLKNPGKALHPDTEGQRRMAEAIEPALSKLLKDTPRTTKK
jgi:lysophospholipase L1-like esterase